MDQEIPTGQRQDQDLPTESATDAPPSTDTIDAPPSPSPLSGWMGILLAFILLSTAGYLSYKTLVSGEPEPLDPPEVVYICAETGKTFKHKPIPGETLPILSPFSNKKTAYPAEKCYWTRDGKAKLIPTYILLNEHIGVNEPTICPDCGRIVVDHNPMPPKGTPIVKDDGAPTTTRPVTASQPSDE